MKIFLIGLPGSGKSSLGRDLARALQLPFVDLDQEIERTEGRPIKEIFKEKEETFFRELESRLLKQWCRSEADFVMATGGGAPCFFDNIQAINAAGVSVFLDVPASEIVDRMMRTKIDERPLLAGAGVDGLRDKIDTMRNHRISFYQQAQVTLTGSAISLSESIAAVQRIART